MLIEFTKCSNIHKDGTCISMYIYILAEYLFTAGQRHTYIIIVIVRNGIQDEAFCVLLHTNTLGKKNYGQIVG